MLGLNEIAATWHLLGCTCTNAMKRITRRKEVQQRRQLQMTNLADSNKQQEQQQWSFKCKSSSLPWPSTSSIQLQGHSRLVAELCSHPAAVQSKSARRQLSWGHCIQSGSKLAVGLFRIQDGHADKVKETQTHQAPLAPCPALPLSLQLCCSSSFSNGLRGNLLIGIGFSTTKTRLKQKQRQRQR